MNVYCIVTYLQFSCSRNINNTCSVRVKCNITISIGRRYSVCVYSNVVNCCRLTYYCSKCTCCCSCPTNYCIINCTTIYVNFTNINFASTVWSKSNITISICTNNCITININIVYIKITSNICCACNSKCSCINSNSG